RPARPARATCASPTPARTRGRRSSASNRLAPTDGGAVMAGTREDATLMVELAKWGAMIDLAASNRVIFADDFDPDAADMRDAEIQSTLVFYETIGTLVKNGLIDRDLILDWLWVKGPWERCAPAVNRARDAIGMPALYENFEALANSQG